MPTRRRRRSARRRHGPAGYSAGSSHDHAAGGDLTRARSCDSLYLPCRRRFPTGRLDSDGRPLGSNRDGQDRPPCATGTPDDRTPAQRRPDARGAEPPCARPAARKRIPMKPRMKLGMFYWHCGHHIAAWRHPEGVADSGSNLQHIVELAKLSEEGLFDMFFMADFRHVLARRPPRHVTGFALRVDRAVHPDGSPRAAHHPSRPRVHGDLDL